MCTHTAHAIDQLLLHTTARRKGNKRPITVTGSGKSLHDPVSMYEDESMASLKEKLIRAEEVNNTLILMTCIYKEGPLSSCKIKV